MAKKSLTRKAKPKGEATEATKWLERIARAKKVREEWRKQFRVDLGYEYWEGRQRSSNVPAHEWITINMIYSTLLAMLPTLYKTNPYFYVKLQRSFNPNPMDVALYDQRAKIRQAFLNYLKDEIEMKPKARLSIQDAFFQYGIAKIHHYADEVENPDAGKPMFDDASQSYLMDDQGQPLIEPDTLPANEAYCLTRVHPDDFLVDEDAGPLNDEVKWKAHRIKVPLEDAKKDKKYRSTARTKLQATELNSDQVQKQREQKKKGTVYASDNYTEPEVVVTWEVYDIKAGEWLIVAEDCDEFLIEPEPVPVGIENDPFVDLRLVLRDDSWYPIPPVSQWLDSQREYCEARSKVMVHRKRFNRKYSVYSQGLLNDNEVTKLEIGDDGTVIQSNTPQQIIWPIQDAPLDQQVHMELTYLRRDFDDLAVGSNQRGSTQGVDSATEAGILEVRAQVREGDWLGLVGDFMIGIARKLDQQVQAHLTADQAVKVTGPQGEYWELVRVQDYQEINGEYAYTLNQGATTPRLPEIERAQFTSFLALIGANPWLAMSRSMLKKVGELFYIEDDSMVDELMQIAQQMMSGQLQQPPAQGSPPGITQNNPMSIMGGQAGGIANFRGGNFS